jgi:hypothetical protein
MVQKKRPDFLTEVPVSPGRNKRRLQMSRTVLLTLLIVPLNVPIDWDNEKPPRKPLFLKGLRGGGQRRRRGGDSNTSQFSDVPKRC